MKTIEKFAKLKEETKNDRKLKLFLKEFQDVDDTIEKLIRTNVVKKKGYDIITIDKISSQKFYFNNSL